MSSYNHFGCSWCGGPFNGRNCPGCSSVGSGNEFVYDPNPYSYNETPNFFNQPPQHQYETYSCELCGDSPHYGFDCQIRTPLVYEQDPCNNQNFSNDQSPYYSPSQPQQFDCCEVYGGPHFSSNCQIRNLLVYEPNPSNNYDFPSFNQPPQYHIDNSQQFDCCEHYGGPPYAFDYQTSNVFYEHEPYENHDSFSFDQPSQFTPPQPLPLSELNRRELITQMIEFNKIQKQVIMDFQNEMNCLKKMLNLTNSNQDPPVDLYDLKRSDEGDNEINSFTKEPLDTLLMGDEVISTILERENDEFIKSSVDDLVPIPRESEVTSVYDDLECDMPVTIPLPTSAVREEVFDINSPLGEYVVDFLMENEDVAGLPRHLVKYLFNHLLKNPSLTKGMSDEPLGDDTKPRSYDEFEDISSLDPPELTPVNDEPTLLVTLPLPCTNVLGDAIVDIDLLLGEQLDTLLTGDREIDFNPIREIEELEPLLVDDPVTVPRVFDDPLGNSVSMYRSSETSDLFEELIAEIGLDDSIPIGIDDRYYDLEGDILYFEQLLNEDSSSDVSPSLLPTEPSLLVTPLPDPKQICLREVERFDPFFSLTRSGNMTRVMETPSLGFHHMSSPRPAAYSPKEVMYHFYHPHLTSGDGFDHGPKMK
ncbi:hypothetical protein Tco_1265958 [Tanacetum coccineum]